MRKLLVVFFALGLLAGIGAAVFVWYSVGLPYRGFEGEAYVDIPKGAGPKAIARSLAQAGIIKYEWDFLIVRALRRSPVLQAGEYRFTEPTSAWTAFDKISNGDVYYEELVVPEGANIFDIAQLAGRLGTIKAKEFLAAAADPGLIRDIAPQAPTLEGYLFPAGYRMTRKTTAAQLVSEMTSRFRRAWKEALNGRPRAMSLHDVVTLASLIEKETGILDERPLVSAVFHNRLRQGMLLQCDPTAIYAALLEDRYRGAIHRSDLDSPNRYNTYQHAGLPPGPIANPGLESLKAALRPAQADFVYFVAKPDGSGAHVFSSELAQHNAAVQEYRRGAQGAEAKPDDRAPAGAPIQPRR